MATGYNRATPASEFHRYSSWGRTRRPKNVNGATSTAEATTVNAAPADLTDGSIAGSYFTENQRYLHMVLDTSIVNQNSTVTVWGYMHAAARWAPLTGVGGAAVTITASNAQAYRIWEIDGVDKVYFQNNVAFEGANFFFAATSTF